MISGSCLPSGSCVEQSDATTGATNICYANGVKELSAVSISGTSISDVVTVKNGSTTCYSMTLDMASALSGGPITMTIKNASGATVGTMAIDSTTGQATVTCTGAAPVVLGSNCSGGLDPTGTTTGSTACTTGPCTP